MISDFTAIGPTTTVSRPARVAPLHRVLRRSGSSRGTARSITSMRRSHFTEATPYQPGTNSRSGKPWLGSSSSPFMRSASSVSGCSALASGRLRAKCIGSGWSGSVPTSAPSNSTSTASGSQARLLQHDRAAARRSTRRGRWRPRPTARRGLRSAGTSGRCRRTRPWRRRSARAGRSARPRSSSAAARRSPRRAAATRRGRSAGTAKWLRTKNSRLGVTQLRTLLQRRLAVLRHGGDDFALLGHWHSSGTQTTG